MTVVVPTAKELPEAKSESKESIPQLSAAEGSVQVTVVAHKPASAEAVMSEGMPLMLGASLSVTVTVKLSVVVLPDSSSAV